MEQHLSTRHFPESHVSFHVNTLGLVFQKDPWAVPLNQQFYPVLSSASPQRWSSLPLPFAFWPLWRLLRPASLLHPCLPPKPRCGDSPMTWTWIILEICEDHVFLFFNGFPFILSTSPMFRLQNSASLWAIRVIFHPKIALHFLGIIKLSASE